MYLGKFQVNFVCFFLQSIGEKMWYWKQDPVLYICIEKKPYFDSDQIKPDQSNLDYIYFHTRHNVTVPLMWASLILINILSNVKASVGSC